MKIVAKDYHTVFASLYMTIENLKKLMLNFHRFDKILPPSPLFFRS